MERGVGMIRHDLTRRKLDWMKRQSENKVVGMGQHCRRHGSARSAVRQVSAVLCYVLLFGITTLRHILTTMIHIHHVAGGFLIRFHIAEASLQRLGSDSQYQKQN